MPAKSARIIASLILLPPLLLLAACSGDDDEPARYAEPRAYAGLIVEHAEWYDREIVLVRRVDESGPAGAAGIALGDFLVSLDGRALESPHDFYARLESKRPGDMVELQLDRPVEAPPDPSAVLPPGVQPGQIYLEHHVVSVDLAEEPSPGEFRFRTPYTSLREDDQWRLGFYLGEITRPVAEHYGVDGPEGVYVVLTPPPFTAAFQAGIEEGDVIVKLAARKVNTLAEVQSVIDGLDENKPVEVVVRRDGRNWTYTVDPLGPDVPGANQLPAEARQRLQAAIDRSDLHPSRIVVLGPQLGRRGDPRPDEPGQAYGAITALSADSITIENYSTGNEWTLRLSRPEPGLRVGEFVSVFTQNGIRASEISSLAEPFPRTP